MNDFQKSLPEDLPGIDVAFGLKQCIGNSELFQTLLHRFWEDYQAIDQILYNQNGVPEEQNTLLHSVKGAAINLGMSDLAILCQELKDDLDADSMIPEEPVERFHKELEKIGGSIKTLDSFIQS